MKMSEEQRKLCEDNLPLAYWYARKWAKSLTPREAQDAAVMGLVQAALTFDLDKSPSGKFASYAVGGMIQHLKAAYASKKRVRKVLIGDFKPDPIYESPSTQIELDDLLRRLSRNEAAILRLRYLEGLSCDEVAARLGISGQRVNQIEKIGLDRARRFANK